MLNDYDEMNINAAEMRRPVFAIHPLLLNKKVGLINAFYCILCHFYRATETAPSLNF